MTRRCRKHGKDCDNTSRSLTTSGCISLWAISRPQRCTTRREEGEGRRNIWTVSPIQRPLDLTYSRSILVLTKGYTSGTEDSASRRPQRDIDSHGLKSTRNSQGARVWNRSTKTLYKESCLQPSRLLSQSWKWIYRSLESC